eukprot:SAG25_NODE_12171_length_286_cov_0.818182_1_plen_45_part_01
MRVPQHEVPRQETLSFLSFNVHGWRNEQRVDCHRRLELGLGRLRL